MIRRTIIDGKTIFVEGCDFCPFHGKGSCRYPTYELGIFPADWCPLEEVSDKDYLDHISSIYKEEKE